MKAFILSIGIFILASPALAAPDIPPVPDTPSAVADLVHVRAFRLENGYRYDWRQEQPMVDQGVLAVFKVNPDLVYPRNAAEPVLYAGDQTVQRLNSGHQSGYVIAIIPGEVDLSRAPVWFGQPDLPERVNAEVIRTQRDLADNADIRSFKADKIESVRQQPVTATDLSELLRKHIAELVLEYSPQERDLVETWRLPAGQPGRAAQ